MRSLEGYVARRAELVVVAAKLFRERGFYNTTLAEILAAAGLDRSTAYYYVSSKEELYLEVVHEELVTLANAATGIQRRRVNASLRLRELIVLLMSSFQEHYPDLYVAVVPDVNRLVSEAADRADDVMQRLLDVGRARRQIYEAFHAVIKDGLRKGEFESPLSPVILANCVIQMVSSSEGWYKPDGSLSGAEIGASLADIAVKGLAPNAPS